jgi:excisionase family DNA binding protein
VSRPTLCRGTYTIREAAARLGISERLAYLLVARNEFPVPTLRLGRVLRVRVAELEEFVRGSASSDDIAAFEVA